jgi:outer membrane protein OmpA-like peptidoglycan-associated protein
MDVRGFALTPDILFATDSDELDTAATGNLDRLAAFLGKYRARTGLIEGYTDNAGVDFGNQDLSLRRAETVRSYLVAHGIDASRLVSVGRGASYPAASNESVVGRQQNRRVEVLISNDQGSTNRAANARLDPLSGSHQLDVRR